MVDQDKIRTATLMLLEGLGADPHNPDLAETPDRVARAWAEIMGSVRERPPTSFKLAAPDQMVVVSGIEAWGVCEHHLMPFKVEAAVGVLGHRKTLGLSKFARIVAETCRGLSTQERLTDRIACLLGEAAQTPSVAVVLNGWHTCMAMRGAKSGAAMTTSSMLGVFRKDPATRAEFMQLAGL